MECFNGLAAAGGHTLESVVGGLCDASPSEPCLLLLMPLTLNVGWT